MEGSSEPSHDPRQSLLDENLPQLSAKSRPRGTPLKAKRTISGIGSDENKEASESDGSENSMSASETLEMNDIGSEAGSDADEETGLTGKERRKHVQRKRQQNELDARIAGDVKVTKEEARLADKGVALSLLVNGLLIGSWYTFSLSISIYNKWMFSSDHLDFHFPLFTTSFHMVVQFFLSSMVLWLLPSLRPKPPPAPALPELDLTESSPRPVITPLFYITRLIPCGSATSLDIGLGNASLRFITLTFYTMCKSSALAFVLLFAFVFRLEVVSWKLILIIATMTVGVVMMVAGETAFNALGFVLIISSAFFSGFRWALTQILLVRHPATGNPFSSLFFLTPIMFFTLFVMACFVEGPRSVVAGLHVLSEAKGTLHAILLLLFPGCLAFCMGASEYALLQRTNVVTLSICGIFKEVVTISAAGIVFHDPLTPINVSGLIVTIASIGAYNYLKIVKMRREARKEVVAIEIERRDSMNVEFLAESEETHTVDQQRGRSFDSLATGRSPSPSPPATRVQHAG